MNTLDGYTIQFSSAVIIAVIAVLMFILWIVHSRPRSIMWWVIFSCTLTVDTVLSTMPEIRNMDTYIYVFNTSASFSYFALLMGFIEFGEVKVNKKIFIGAIILCALINTYGLFNPFEDETRRMVIIGFNTLFLIGSTYVLHNYDDESYSLEKALVLFLLITHLTIHAYWFYLEFDVSGVDNTSFARSVSPIYLVLILIMISLLLLTLGRTRNELEKKIEKSVAVKNALSHALMETNVANKSKSVFLTNMSHELRTPLNIIIGFSDALKMEMYGPLNDKQKGFIGNIHFSGLRLLTLINDLLNLSSIESQSLPKKLRKIRLSELIEPNEEKVKEIAAKYGASLYIIDDTDHVSGLAFIYSREEWITQILTALIGNAAKYGNRGGKIWLNIFELNDDVLRITVKDEGHGIAKNEISNVFKPFNRAGVDNRAIEGTGAGLAIVKGLVDAMSGKIGFNTVHGEGTTFWIDIPLNKV
ncbi:sensor histidine kinase [Pseudemcibacter aquimaris]|uniref:sensor histidine kinase n=1 Tax=Pseudemcibacter aquimaris TaxID=2857064 RepID=UPI0020119BE9|nr:HAMP domain-containing sensor histidine kinase [Pseudemcibacter aquimaris]MCC3859819.1 HAMP domain-containing histidine kinase [Pseudemcibacter aquimaris]WDU60213.1 HAMP domain-containing histidine kinase [Pseudemcibacter aquimaris]